MPKPPKPPKVTALTQTQRVQIMCDIMAHLLADDPGKDTFINKNRIEIAIVDAQRILDEVEAYVAANF